MKTFSKISILGALAISFTLSANAQQTETYKVVKVQGEILRVKTGNILSICEDVVSNENLSFKDNYSRAMVVNKDRGCMILSAKSDNGGPQFLPAQNNMSVRAAVPAQPSEVLDFFYGQVAITGCDSLKIDNDKLPIGADSYFTVNYTVNGKEINGKMEFKNGKLALPASIIQDKPEKVEICYNNEFGLRKKSEFMPVYVNGNDLKKEIGLILNAIQGENESKITASVIFVNDFYGKTTIETMKPWIDNNLK